MHEDNRKISELDQALAAIGDSFPPLWRRLYIKCLAEGFNSVESMELVKKYIESSIPH